MRRALFGILLLASFRCGSEDTAVQPNQVHQPHKGVRLTLLAGSENETLQPLIERFAERAGAEIAVTYKGSVDIMLALESGAAGIDAVWPANGLWLALGDRQGKVRHVESIMRSPVILGLRKSVAKRLGWLGRDVTVADILAAAEKGELRYMMTSATQSNSGASAYIGFLYSFAGSPDTLTIEHLRQADLEEKTRRILGTVNRSSGSSGWLKELFLDKYDSYDGMINYEALIIETNQTLVQRGLEPLVAIYPVDGLTIADSPLGFVDHGDAGKEKLFRDLQQYLLSSEVQQQIVRSGRRVGMEGLGSLAPDRAVFNADWGIDVERILTPIRFPQPEVVREALRLYQTSFRKPSFTVYCLDYSGSMRDAGETELKDAMRTLLDQDSAARYLLQASTRDRTIVIPFNHEPLDLWVVRGSDAGEIRGLLSRILALPAQGGTDIYSPVLRAVELLEAEANLEDYSPAIILMTDGKSEHGLKVEEFRKRWVDEAQGLEVPVYPIVFGQAEEMQLQEIATMSSGRVFVGKDDLFKAFRTAKGYN